MAADDVQQLHDIELHELTKTLQKQLKKDIARIYSESLFSDVEIALGNTLLKANCCILKVRASAFYSELCSLQNIYSNGCILEISTVERIKSLVRKIYEQDYVHAAESLVVKLLKDVCLSPDFEQYATPLTSPSEIFESENHSSFKSCPCPSYYSIVPLDWEKELAEQDFLFESFRSILYKEQSKTQVKSFKKSSSSNCSSIYTDPYSRSLLDLKKAVEEDCLLLQEEGVPCDILLKESILNVQNSKIFSKKVVKCHIVSPLQCKESADALNECGFFDAEDSFSPCNDSLLIDMFKGISEKSKMSSNMDMGPDSGLATSAEDIPLDQEGGLEVSKSISSSVSSDCCVWDSSSAPQQSDLNSSWVDCAAHKDKSENQSDFVDRVLEELVSKSQAQNQKQAGGTASECFDAFSLGNTSKHSFFIDASSLLDETEIQHASAAGAEDMESSLAGRVGIIPCDVPNPIHNRTQEWQSLDERGELSRFPRNDTESPVNQTSELSSAHSSSIKKEGGNSMHNTPFERKVFPPQKVTKEEKPPSLIRSNTFELKTEDDRLSVLRQEYERRQGCLVFQRCESQPAGPLSDSGPDDESSQHCTSLILPNSDAPLNVASMSLLFTHVVEDEIQTPDSLNSDLPETVGEDICSDSTAEVVEGSLREKDADEEDYTEVDVKDNLPSGVSNLCINEVSSPLFSRRKTESAPILSGGVPPLLPEIKPLERKVRVPHAGPLSSAWVVDISDITSSPEARRRRTDLSSASSSEHQSSEFKNEQPTPESKSLSSRFGFFVDMKDPKLSLDDRCDSMSQSEGSKLSRQSSDSGKVEKQGACEFFVDLNHPNEQQSFSPNLSDTSHPEKKLFSMFIDIGDKVRPKAKPDLASRSRTPLSPFSAKRKTSAHVLGKQSDTINGKGTFNDVDEKSFFRASVKNDSGSSQISTMTKNSDPKKNNFLTFINTETDIKNSKLISSKSVISGSPHVGKEKINTKPQHVRAHSVSYVKKNTGSDNSITSNLTTSTRLLSSLSLQNAETILGNDSKSTKAMFSSCHASLQTEDSQEIQMNRNQEEMTESSELSSHVTTGSNESSVCSLETYSVHTPEQSSATDDHSSEKKDSFRNFYISKENECQVRSKYTERKFQSQTSILEKKLPKDKIICISEHKLKPDKRVTKSFVRLSDLDKEPVSSSDQSASAVAHRMSRSIPETSWIERKTLMSHSAGGGSAVLSSSSRSLSRLFPNMSMHASGIGRSKTSSTCSQLTEDLDTMRSSQVSELSSMQSSAGLEYSTESTDISDRGSPATQLGDDLLKMFLEEISTDVIVEVGGRRIKAHKCILSSRCQYFAAILSGGWVESAGNVISLQGFSYTVVHFALCHIYCGTSTIPDQISIVELASLADMLSLEGLKDVIMYTLKVKYCHFFHKPCAVCSVGVLECLPLAAAYGLDDIYRKSLRWITKYFVRIWPTKSFTALSRDIIEKCYQQHVIHMTPENVLETILCCDKLLSTIPTVRWAEPVFVLTSRLMETCIKFMSENFCAILASDNFLSLGREVPWNVSRFQDSLVAACERMPPDQSCRSYTQLCSVLSVVQELEPPPEMTWHPNFVDLLIQLQDLSERTLIRQAARAARTPGWGQMPTDLRRKIQDAACLVLAPADHASSRYKRSSSDGSRQINQRSSYSRNLDLHQVKMAMAQHARRANSNDYHQTVSSVVVRKNIPSDRSNTVTRRSAPVASNKPAERPMVTSQGRPKTWPAQVKSRYLEKRPTHSKQPVESQERNKQLDAPIPQRRVPAPVKGMFISSSDSSRNSSPAMKRSSNVSSNPKTIDPSSKTRAATVIVSNLTQLDAEGNAVEQEVFFKSSDNLARHSVSSKAQSMSETFRTPPVARKMDIISHDNPAKLERSNKQASSALGNHSRSISMSNDSLATVSSCDDTHSTHSGKKVQTKSSAGPKRKSLGLVESDKKPELPRTPLSMANKKTSPSTAQRRMPLLPSKTLDSNSSSSPSSLMSKRSISHIAKSPVLSNTVSRLAIPLRTSRSVSSVPDKGHVPVKVNPSEGHSGKKIVGKSQSRSNITSGSSKRAGHGGSAGYNSSIAGKALASKGSKAINSLIKSANCNNSDKCNGDNSLDGAVHPTVGPRSGTFLKDEPTVLQTPSVENN